MYTFDICDVMASPVALLRLNALMCQVVTVSGTVCFNARCPDSLQSDNTIKLLNIFLVRRTDSANPVSNKKLSLKSLRSFGGSATTVGLSISGLLDVSGVLISVTAKPADAKFPETPIPSCNPPLNALACANAFPRAPGRKEYRMGLCCAVETNCNEKRLDLNCTKDGRLKDYLVLEKSSRTYPFLPCRLLVRICSSPPIESTQSRLLYTGRLSHQGRSMNGRCSLEFGVFAFVTR